MAHLESVIHEVKKREPARRSHLKSEIAALQLSKERDVEHLQEQVSLLTADRDSLRTALEQSMDNASQFAVEAEQLKAKVEFWQTRSRQLEGSTLWRMMTPVRWVLHRIKLLFYRPSVETLALHQKGVAVLSLPFCDGGVERIGRRRRAAPQALATPSGCWSDRQYRIAGIDRA